MNKKLLISITAIFVLAILCTALLPTSVAYATQYGSVDSTDLDTFWYYGEGHLNVAEMKKSISSWIAGADKENPVIIGVVDTGVNVSHEVFEKTNTIFAVDGKPQGYNAHVAQTVKNATIEQLGNVEDKSSNSHGTAVASIMAMLIYDLGLEDYIKIYPIQASTGSADGSFNTTSVVKALEFVDSTKDTLGVDVVNIAIAGYKDKGADNYLNYQSKFQKVSAGSVIVVAAGNKGASTTVNPSYPASLEGVVSVMAYDRTGNKNTNSNYGDYDLIVPGKDIYVAQGSEDDYTTMDGTSMATAFVSVVSAVVSLREQTADSTATASLVARHILTSSSDKIEHDGFALNKFDGYKSVNNQITATYLDPTGISISNNHDLEKESTIYRGQYGDLTLTANLLPFGNTDPKLAEKVIWTQTEILSKPVLDEDGNDTGNTEEYKGETVELGVGASIEYNPNLKGKYLVTATYKNGDVVFEDTMTFTVNYVDYSSVAGILAVKPLPSVEGGTIDNGFVYEFDKATFYLAGSEGLDPSVEIKWYVNGELVHTGERYTHKAGMMGIYEISARYGDNRVIEKVYSLEVKSGFLRPAVWITLTAVVVVASVVLGVVFGIKNSKKNKQDNE